jgi:hypothetical protein
VLASQLTSGAEHSPSESQAADARLIRHIDASANSSMLFGFWYPAMPSRDLRVKDFSLPFYGYNRPSAKVSEGVRVSPFGFLTHSLARIDSQVWRAYGWHGLTVGQVCHVSTCSWCGTILGG